jgi:hypothetical protein
MKIKDETIIRSSNQATNIYPTWVGNNTTIHIQDQVKTTFFEGQFNSCHGVGEKTKNSNRIAKLNRIEQKKLNNNKQF